MHEHACVRVCTRAHTKPFFFSEIFACFPLTLSRRNSNYLVLKTSDLKMLTKTHALGYHVMLLLGSYQAAVKADSFLWQNPCASSSFLSNLQRRTKTPRAPGYTAHIEKQTA